jgi:cell division inhibitor SepF
MNGNSWYRSDNGSLGNSQRPLFSEKSPNAASVNCPRSYSSVIVYQPMTTEDVQTLIDYLKRREPAIVNLDGATEAFAQRILDFISGAVYALSGSVHRISGNIFLLTPEGVEISIPYAQ